MKKLIASVKAFWASLPHQVQAACILFGTAVITTLGKEFQALIFGTANFTRSSLQHDLSMAIVAGVVAVRAFYMVPSQPAEKSAELPAAK
jgi:ABC-type Co2+ transport system permease subunit